MSAKTSGQKKYSMSYILAVIAIVYFAVGIVLIFRADTLTAVVCMIGCGLVILGVFRVVQYLRNNSHMNPQNYDFSIGVLMVILGVLLLVQNQAVSKWLPHLLAVCVVITSVMKMQNALALQRMKDENWTLFFLMAVVTLILSCVILFWKKKFVSENGEINLYVPIVLLVDGLFDLINMFRLGSRMKKMNSMPAPVMPGGPADQPQTPAKTEDGGQNAR